MRECLMLLSMFLSLNHLLEVLRLTSQQRHRSDRNHGPRGRQHQTAMAQQTTRQIKSG
jgi:hypothetical protein